MSFVVRTVQAIEEPNRVVYTAMRQCHSDELVDITKAPDERKCGELIVKHLLNGGKGHYGCYSSDTEVLTNKGWMSWVDVYNLYINGDKPRLLAVNIENNSCSFEFPSAVQRSKLDANDSMYTVESQYLNFSVTGDHRMVVSSRTKNGGFSPWYIKTAQEVYGKPVRYLLSSCLSDGDRILPDCPKSVDTLTAFRLAGFFFGDGIQSENKNPGCIRFKLRKPRKIAYLVSLGLKIDECKDDRYVIHDKELSLWIHKNFSSKDGKVVPSWILTLPKAELAAFWDGLKNSDGTVVEDNVWCYDSCEKEALDLIQAAAHINGFSANMSLNNPNIGEEHINHRPCWRIRISEKSTRRVETCHSRSPGIRESWKKASGDEFVYCATVSTGALMVRRKDKVIVLGNCLEHPSIVLQCGHFPHSVMQQARTHRVGISFDVSSFRNVSTKLLQVAEGKIDIEDVIYFRPLGRYVDRKGAKYEYTDAMRVDDRVRAIEAVRHYANRLASGMSEEHARGLLPFDYRQNFVVSFNCRSLMHFLDLRAKKDAQLEIQQMAELMMTEFKKWMPEVAEWYEENRWGKARLSP